MKFVRKTLWSGVAKRGEPNMKVLVTFKDGNTRGYHFHKQQALVNFVAKGIHSGAFRRTRIIELD